MVQYVNTEYNDPVFSNSQLSPSQLLTISGATYPTKTNNHWTVDWSNIASNIDQHPWHYDFYGSGFTYDANGMIAGGKIQRLETWEHNNLSFSLTGLSLSAKTLLSYAASGNDQGFVEYVFQGNDTLTGSSNIEGFFGYKGNDTIDAGSNHDWINGGPGNDVLTGGGPELDIFEFNANWGKDRITDFQVPGVSGDEHDVLKFDEGLFADFNDLMAHTTDVEGGVMIKLDKNNTILLENVTKAQLIELGSDPNHTEAFVFGSHPDVFNPFA